MNETSLVLEWSEPRDSGGRDDLLYNVICKKCSVERRLCMRCDDNVEFVPRQLGLTERHIYISNLMAHTQYTFEIQAVNGVSSKSLQNPQFASVNITTNQAGECFMGKGGQLPRLSLAISAEPAVEQEPLGLRPFHAKQALNLESWSCHGFL